jgi:integrase
VQDYRGFLTNSLNCAAGSEVLNGVGCGVVRSRPAPLAGLLRHSSLFDPRRRRGPGDINGRRAPHDAQAIQVLQALVRKRALAVGIMAPIGNHSFRATGITAYLANGGALEHAQAMAAHESPRTTKLYDRTTERLTQDEVGRIKL